jgi:hypothetical protein
LALPATNHTKHPKDPF